MTIRRVFMVLVAIACLIAGFAAAGYLDRLKYAREAGVAREASMRELASLRDAAAMWTEAGALAHGEGVARAFAAGIAPAVLTGRRDQIASAGIGLLRVAGVVAIHVLGVQGDVLYSSDAKVSTTGDAGDRGNWARAVEEPTSQASLRAGALDTAVPITSSEGKKLAVVWLEFDVAGARDAARPSTWPLPEDASSGGQRAGAVE